MKLCRQCKNCGNTIFYTNSLKDVKYFCNKKCYTEYQRKGNYKYSSKNIFNCTFCGKEIIGKKKKYKRNGEVADNIFCDRQCYDKYRRRNSERCCLYCNSKFIGIGDKKNAQFCNDICRRKYFTQKTYSFCVVCGQGFYPFTVDKRNGNIICDTEIITCSDACKRKREADNELIRRIKISKSITGNKHANWEGGRDRYRGENWSHQKYLAKVRDNYICQRCGITQKNAIKKYKSGLEVHHIIPYRYFNNDFMSANNLSNLVSLCKSCHQLTEWEYRREHENEN